ncbi:MAG: YvcK family protein [Lentisphaerae bacterium]|nr:YvcK family protein [Lentisphaerota bacterium]
MSLSNRAAWSSSRSSLEHAVEGVLAHLSVDPRAAGGMPEKARVVVLGGGTGLSTVLGGNASLPSWPDRPPEGLAQEFDRLDIGVCTTDDGGSTGELVRRLPMIGIGDMRKVMLSMTDRSVLVRRHGPDAPILKIIQQVFQHRFDEHVPTREELHDPVRVLTPALRRACPASLRAALAGLSTGLDRAIEERMRVPGHCLGNLLLTASVFRRMRSQGQTLSPVLLDAGIGAVADVLGIPPARLFAATASPGSLIFEYANGVVATGQSRAARARRGCAVRRVRISFSGTPAAHPRLLERLREADLIIYAPGSLYSSMLPVLLTPGVVEAIRANRRAVKILGANLWIQEGETDMSFREESRGFWVSELIEAYGRNVPGGIAGLFDVALATSLDTVPGSIIRNYALEGKHPIHLDRSRVAALGVMPVEASLFSNDRWHRHSMIHHDPARFAAAVRIVFSGLAGRPASRSSRRIRTEKPSRPGAPAIVQGPSACTRMDAIRRQLAGKAMRPASLRRAIEDFLWRHPDVPPAHLEYFNGVQVVPDSRWRRSREWDNVLGYYDPESGRIMLHEQAIRSGGSFEANFAVALGESLLGRYIAGKRWQEPRSREGCRIYEIELRPSGQRASLLSDAALRTYLRAARMQPRKGSPLCHWRAVPSDSGFLPCGILFGLTYAWMLDNVFVPALDFEMQMLQWPISRLLPYQVRERSRQRDLVRFFRDEVLGHS